jgi:hypothetical protein
MGLNRYDAIMKAASDPTRADHHHTFNEDA